MPHAGYSDYGAGSMDVDERYIHGNFTTEIEDPIAELKRIERVLQRRRWLDDPEAWATERGRIELWSGERLILRSVRQHRRTAVKSCHEVGKSFSAGSVACWWLDAHRAGEAFVVTSAPSTAQVKAILWREIGKLHARAGLRGRLNQSEWYETIIEKNGRSREELVAFGRKPDEYDETAFQGIHAPYVLVLMDEACGIHGPLWEAADSLIANDDSKILLIGNPDDPASEFAAFCQPGSGYNVITIDAFSSPNFTGEPLSDYIKKQLIGRTYVEEKRRKWAPKWYWVNAQNEPCEVEDGVKCVPPDGVAPEETAPGWQAKILAQFPIVPEDMTLIPPHWIKAAQDRELQPGEPNELGQDVGGGGDESVIAHRRGGVVRIRRSDRNPDTMQTCGNLLAEMAQTAATLAKVDVIGIGRGVVNRAQELQRAVIGINVGEAADHPEDFLNRRAELYWHIRGMFERGEIDLDPEDDDLAQELGSIRFKRTSKGQIQIESKADAKRRGVPSPNRAEAAMLSVAPPRENKRKVSSLTWGSSENG